MKLLSPRIASLLFVGLLAIVFFERTSGAAAVRPVQVLLLIAGGMCFGTALTLFRVSRQAGRSD